MQLLNNLYIDKDENERRFQKALAENDDEGMWEAVFIESERRKMFGL